MRILATIPELPAAVDRAGQPPVRPADGEPVRRQVPTAAGRSIRRDPRPAFPLGSIAALLALAAVAWTLAGWNEARRTGRQQAERRRADAVIAEQPATAEEPVIR